jgi:hypothetical protein
MSDLPESANKALLERSTGMKGFIPNGVTDADPAQQIGLQKILATIQMRTKAAPTMLCPVLIDQNLYLRVAAVRP